MRTTLGTADAGDDVRAAIHRLGPAFERDYITHTPSPTGQTSWET